MASILLYTDEPMLLAGFELALRQVAEFQLQATCTKTDLIEQLATAAPDIALIDLTPEISYEILQKLLTTAINTKVVVWSRFVPATYALELKSLGVRGILNKTLPTYRQLECLQQIAEGQLWFEQQSPRNDNGLTRREIQLAELVSQGLKNKQAATILGLSEGATKVYLHHIFAKLGVQKRADLVGINLGIGRFTGRPSNQTTDRRRLCRYPIEFNAIYQTVGGETTQIRAKVLNASSGGLLTRAEQPVAVGRSVELKIDWPVLLNDAVAVKLLVWGHVVRSHGLEAAVKFDTHEFRTGKS